MKTLSLFSGVLFAVFLAGGTCSAAEGAWKINESEGLVRVQQPAGGMHKASLEEALDAGATLTTGGDGRVVLSRGDKHIVVGPNSRMTIPAESNRGVMHVLQDLGTLMFKIDKQPHPHFEVDTPMIAAVVKGTTFTVTVGANYAEVHVAEGLVEVKTPDGIGQAMVPSGVTAFVSKADPSKIEIQSPSTTGTPPAGKAAAIPAGSGGQTATISGDLGPGKPDLDTLTNGLLQSSQHANGNASAQGPLRAGSAIDMASTNAQGTPFASVHSQLGASVNGNGNVNAGGANSNAGGNGNGNGNGNANANAGGNGNANSNAGGNGNANANANASGNGNGNANSNAGGNGNGNGNGNANSNAGGNGNGKGNSGGA